MTTRLAQTRSYLLRNSLDAKHTVRLSKANLVSATTTPTTVTAALDTEAQTAAIAILTEGSNIKDEDLRITSPEGENFAFMSEDDVAAAALENVITQKKLPAEEGEQTTEVAIIVVGPMDASESSNDGNGGSSLQGISTIKNSDELAQQVANGQVVVQAEPTNGEDGPTQFIVAVSSQDPNQNFHLQYVDAELYHNNSSQSQMTYSFCPVGDYQTNGQSYYPTTPTGNYPPSAGANPPTAPSSIPSYVVPVDDPLLLNSSSQSHSRDSPHSLSEVTYIQDAQSTPQTPTSTTAPAGNIGGSGASSENEQNPLGNKVASATMSWLSRNYETAEGVSLPRSTLYNHYIQHCQESKLEPVNAASFGKLIRTVFSGLRTRRLGTRGNSKYHYYGIRIKPGSVLNHSMDDSSTNSAVNATNANGAVVNTSVSSSGSSGSASSGNRMPKKFNFKPDAYEACAQFLGDGTGAIPTFPPIELSNTFNSELSQEDADTFRTMYREHCESFLDAVLQFEFWSIESLLRDFWRATDNNNLDECEEEKLLSKTKLYLLCHCAEVQRFIQEVDYQFYQNMVDVIIPDVLRSIPNTLTQAIRNFAKNMEIWLCEAVVGVPKPVAQIKNTTVSAFCQMLRRYTSLNHLAQAARAVLQNSAQIAQMLSDLNRVDFHNVQEQAAWVCQCNPATVQCLENDFKTALQQQNSLEQWASWLTVVVDKALQSYRGSSGYADAARKFLLKWSYYSSMVIRDLTLRSASSFGSFHLIRLLYDEYMFYLIEHKIADAQQKTAIAVICDRNRKDPDYELDYHLDLIRNDEGCVSSKQMKHE